MNYVLLQVKPSPLPNHPNRVFYVITGPFESNEAADTYAAEHGFDEYTVRELVAPGDVVPVEPPFPPN